MDSTLLDQIRHLCRDRASYEHLKAILVQQERVLQLSWEERYEKLMADQAPDTQASNIFGNILAREKALAQLADAIQRSPSLELVLQVAVQVAQKVLQVDRVAIFRRHADGRGEFVTDAIASGLVSIADMPERQLLLSRHMIESMQTGQSAQTVDNIRSSSLSSHLVTLLEQIGISTYAANKIYAGHEAWGILVAFHGSIYHNWSESDRTSLSLLAAQIGIAISLANLRQQSQTLMDDLQNLQIELDSLQKVVSDIISKESKTASKNSIALPTDSNVDDIAEPFITLFPQDITPQDITPQDIAAEESQALDVEISESESQTEEIDEEVADSEIADSESVPISQGVISQNGLPRLFLIPEEELIPDPDDSEIDQDPAPVRIDADDLPVITAIASESRELENITAVEPQPEIIELEPEIIEPEPERIEPERIELERIELEIIEPELERIELDTSKVEDFDTKIVDLEVLAELLPELLIEPQPLELQEPDLDADETDKQEAIAVEPNQDSSESSTFELSNDDRDPAIEPQFIETILSIASHAGSGVRFLLNVIDTYLEETPLLVQSIAQAIAVNDHSQLLQSLNTLRANSDYIGALALSYQCRELESAVSANDTVLMTTCLSQVVIEAQRSAEALRIERSHYV